VLRSPMVASSLRGIVVDSSQAAIAGAHVEFLRQGTTEILRTVTDAPGHFRIDGAPDGRYRFKVAMDGFCGLVGTVIVDRHAADTAELSLVLRPGI
jgi:Carboxypeptidase regulatory-like domain